MPINLKLGDGELKAPELDSMSRSWVGWKAEFSDDEIYEHNRGLWFLGRPAYKEQIATFSYMSEVVVVVALTGIEYIAGAPAEGAKQAIIGKVLREGDTDYDALIGHPVDSQRNPVTYLTGSSRRCLCGCGRVVSGKQVFLVGHDRKAIRDRITKQWGNTRGFVEWFDTTYGSPQGTGTDEI